MHCKYLSVVPYKALQKFSKALYGTTGSTYSARVFRPVMENTDSDFKVHALHYANELLVRVRLSFQKHLQKRSTYRNNRKKCLGKE